MKIDDAEFFFANYVGCEPEDDKKCRMTQDMISHYIDSGLRQFLPLIYESCAKDGFLGTMNIPRQLWKDGNLLEEGVFYLHPELTIHEPAPVYDPQTDSVVSYPHFRENKERYNVFDAVCYADKMLKRDEDLRNDSEDVGAVRYILKRYDGLKKKNIQPVDMLLFLIDAHAHEALKLINLTDGEDAVLETILSYKAKLEDMGQFKVVWRGSLSE